MTLTGVLVLLGYSVTVPSQQSGESNSEQRNRGIQLYKQGDVKGAAKILSSIVRQNKSDADAWYFLGLALVRDDDFGNARKAFAATVKLRPDFGLAHTGLAYTLLAVAKNEEAGREARRAIELNIVDPDAHYILGVVYLRFGRNTEALAEAELAIAQKPNLAPPYLLKCETLLALEGEASGKSAKVRFPASRELTEEEREERRRLRQKSAQSFASAANALESYLSFAASSSETPVWREQLETLRLFAGNHQTGELEVVSGGEVTTQVRVLEKPGPTYTERARAAGIVGTVILRAVFSAEGKVEHILVLRSLPGGLTEKAIQTARKIRFTPATKDGKPVAMFMELQYNFNLY